MKYITSSFSNLMFRDKKSLLQREELTEDQFYKEAINGFSYIGSEDIAKELGFAYNRETIKACEEDVILNVTKDHGDYKFFKVRVVPSTQCCNHEYCEELL